jgi:transposase-like protein
MAPLDFGKPFQKFMIIHDGKKAKKKLHQIWMAPEKAEAEKHIDDFIEIYEAKYPKAVECLKKDRDVLLTFYDFPAEHWRHIRTTKAFKLCQSAQKRWQRLHHSEKLAEVIKGIKFVNGDLTP